MRLPPVGALGAAPGAGGKRRHHEAFGAAEGRAGAAPRPCFGPPLPARPRPPAASQDIEALLAHAERLEAHLRAAAPGGSSALQALARARRAALGAVACGQAPDVIAACRADLAAALGAAAASGG